MQKLFNLLFDENYVILFYRNNFSIYLIIVSGLDTLVLGKILDILFSYYDWLIYGLDSVLRRIGMDNISAI